MTTRPSLLLRWGLLLGLVAGLGVDVTLRLMPPAQAAIVRGPGQVGFQLDTVSFHAPTSNTVATTTKAACGSGCRNVATSITATLAIGAIAPGANHVSLYLRDGAAGAGTIIWQASLTESTVAGSQDRIILSGVNIAGSLNTALTLEFSAAGGNDTYETVALTSFALD
jgi:hypothetical protein